MRKLIEFYDNIKEEWRDCHFIGYTSQGHTIVEIWNGRGEGVTVIPDGHAQLRDKGIESGN